MLPPVHKTGFLRREGMKVVFTNTSKSKCGFGTVTDVRDMRKKNGTR